MVKESDLPNQAAELDPVKATQTPEEAAAEEERHARELASRCHLPAWPTRSSPPARRDADIASRGLSFSSRRSFSGVTAINPSIAPR